MQPARLRLQQEGSACRLRLQQVGIGGSGFARKEILAGFSSSMKAPLAALASPGRQPFTGSAFARKVWPLRLQPAVALVLNLTAFACVYGSAPAHARAAGSRAKSSLWGCALVLNLIAGWARAADLWLWLLLDIGSTSWLILYCSLHSSQNHTHVVARFLRSR